jgi:hypothetical protein
MPGRSDKANPLIKHRDDQRPRALAGVHSRRGGCPTHAH